MRKNKDLLYLILAILCIWTPLFMGAWDKDKPSSSTSLRSSNPEILANWDALETAIGNEHEYSTGGTNSGDHIQGSARCFSQATAPTTQIDGGSFASTDIGSLWIDSDDNAIYILTATTPTWTAVSTEVIATLLGSARIFTNTLGVTGDFTVNTDKFTVTAASGNTLVAGTLDVTGATEVTGIATLGDASLLKTSAAPSTDAMIANKKYVDDQVATNAFSAIEDYGTSLTTSTSKNQSDLIFCYGRIAASATGDYTITGLPFTNSTSYVVTIGYFAGENTLENPTVTYISGASFKVTNFISRTQTFSWHAIGT